MADPVRRNSYLNSHESLKSGYLQKRGKRGCTSGNNMGPQQGCCDDTTFLCRVAEAFLQAGGLLLEVLQR